MKMSRYGIALLVAVAFGLAGCASVPEVPGTAGEPSMPGPSLEVRGIPEAAAGVASVRAFAGDSLIVVVTEGSSSCPTVPDFVSEDPEQKVVRVSLTTWEGAEFCTADVASRTFEVPVGQNPDGVRVEILPDGTSSSD